MKKLFNKGVKQYLKLRYRRIETIRNFPQQVQERVLKSLLHRAKATKYGRKYNFSRIENYADFTSGVPFIEYDEVKDDIRRMMDGESDVLWKGKVNWYSKSSGTTSDRSKYIPVSEDSMYKNNVACSWDTMAITYHEDEECEIFFKKSLIMGGAISTWPDNPSVTVGDISAILLHRMPTVGRPFYSPDFETAILADWEEKIEKMSMICAKDDVVMFGGVPTWTIVLFNRMMEIKGAQNMHEIWPSVKYYFHGGVGFEPYVEQFKTYFPDPGFNYFEVYNASEGYFAVQDRADEKGMLLLLDNDIFYEFIPMERLHEEHPKALPIWEVEKERNYAIVISSSSGLWRYLPGDTVAFTSLHPYRIRIAGRTKHFINVFGEEVMVGDVEKAISKTISKMPAKIVDYTIAPIFMESEEKGGHQWIVEFAQMPSNVDQFEVLLDEALQQINSDYAAKRYKNLALKNLKIRIVPQGTFHKWLSAKGKVGGQNKVPRLFNSRKYAEELLSII